jgi:membrane protein
MDKTCKSEHKVSRWELVVRVAQGVLKDDCNGYSAEIAFFLFFALFPCLLSLAILLACLPVPDLFRVVLKIMGPFLPANVFFMIEENLRTLALAQTGGILSFGVLLSLWTASNAILAVQTALNDAYSAEEQRPYWTVRITSILLAISLACFIIISLLFLTFIPRFGTWIASLAHLGTAFSSVWNSMRWPVILWLMMTALSVLYRYAPAIRLSWRETFPGAVTATGAWVAITLVFSSYANTFSSYVDTYGSIGAIIALLVWLYASAFVTLIGGEINARMREVHYENTSKSYKRRDVDV